VLSPEQIDQAAHHLVAARKAKTPGPTMPESYRPADYESAIAIQERVLEILGEAVGGWKCGTPNPLTGPVFAPLAASGLLRSSPCAVPGDVGLIEPEIAFVMAHDLPPRATPYTDAEIRAAIGEARLVLEFITTHYADRAAATAPEILADAYSHHALFIGPVITNVLDHPLERLHVTIRTAAGALFDKVHPHPSGHPLKSLGWLVPFLNSRGQGVKAGQIVTTGSYAGIVEAPIGVPINVQLNDFGSFNVELITDRL
jgi:2-keto-4-pentenoate hydratase